jgi:hypothetical protein
MATGIDPLRLRDPLEELRARLREAVDEADPGTGDRFAAGRHAGLLEALGMVYDLLRQREALASAE